MKTDVTLPEEGAANPKPPEKPAAPAESRSKESATKKPSSENPPGENPFQKAKTVSRRLKCLLWGDFGTGKTTLALQFPKPVVLDLEGGTDHYGDHFEFDVLKATTAEQVTKAVDWLLVSKHNYRTLVIDPITIFFESSQRYWSEVFLQRSRTSKGFKFEFFDLGPKEWMVIKAALKETYRKLLSLDMNVIVTARQKTLFKEGSFMVSMGETFDGEKSLPYMFDTIVRLYRDEQGRYMAQCLKDRSQKLPKEPFESKYEAFEALLGKESLSRKAEPLLLATIEQKAKIHAFIEKLGLSSDYVEERLAAYGAESIDELTAKDADVIISKLQAALAAREQKTGGQSHAGN